MPKPIYRKYVAEITSDGVEVLVYHSDYPGDTLPLEPHGGGFEWGYVGGGPHNLAHAMLADCIPDRFDTALMRELVAERSPIDEHRPAVVFTEEEILIWLREKLNALPLGDA